MVSDLAANGRYRCYAASRSGSILVSDAQATLVRRCFVKSPLDWKILVLTDYPQNDIKLAEETSYELRFERLPTEEEHKAASLTHIQDVTNNLILHNPSKPHPQLY